VPRALVDAADARRHVRVVHLAPGDVISDFVQEARGEPQHALHLVDPASRHCALLLHFRTDSARTRKYVLVF
jgi:hypothetical protein